MTNSYGQWIKWFHPQQPEIMSLYVHDLLSNKFFVPLHGTWFILRWKHQQACMIYWPWLVINFELSFLSSSLISMITVINYKVLEHPDNSMHSSIVFSKSFRKYKFSAALAKHLYFVILLGVVYPFELPESICVKLCRIFAVIQ